MIHAITVPSPGETLKHIWRHGPLRRTLGLTITVAFSVAALPIYAVAIAPVMGSVSASGLLVAAYGVGNLLGSTGLMLRPFRGNVDRLTSFLAVLVAAGLTLVILAPTLGIKAKKTRPYRPQTNGKIERFHRTSPTGGPSAATTPANQPAEQHCQHGSTNTITTGPTPPSEANHPSSG
ncbi:hypothetical protein IWX75_002220 [Arthrobacter sp. CAN_A6]